MTDAPRDMLRLQALTIKRRKASPLLRDLTIAVAAGEILAVVGQSGIGKSSLLNVIAGFVALQGQSHHSLWSWFDDEDDLEYEGSVQVEGLSIDGTPPEERATIGMVMQGGVIYEHMSVLQNVTFPMRLAGNRKRNELRHAALALLAEVELFDDLPQAELERRLKEKAHKLSGGERQRVALARALAKNPSVFLLDEAFANLDPVLRAELFDKFARLIVGQQRCAVVVTHDLSDLARVQRILLLGPGPSGPAHWSYSRGRDNAFILDGESAGESDYWKAWHSRIGAATS
jgi:ABC-type nitrate/sulfonate/bicarbonate transport system ATPase subunit